TVLQLLRKSTHDPYTTLFRSYSKVNQTNSGGVVTEGQQNRSGESWSRGHVILSWSEVQQGMNYIEDGHNVVFHEFAHQLDETFRSEEHTSALQSRVDLVCRLL